jgi:endonuclease III
MRLKKTGSIWLRTEDERSEIVEEVCKSLLYFYGTSRLGNPKDPVSDLVFIIISNKTTPEMARLIYKRLRSQFVNWEYLIAVPSNQKKLRTLIRPAGLSRVKSKQIWYALNKIRRDFGRCSLQKLKKMGDVDVHEYLIGLRGVSDKVAKCVMMYTMGRQVLPVDAHVHRVARRLGWTSRKRADQSHEELEALVAPSYRYNYHVNCIQHGRIICLPQVPLCDICPIKRFCEYYAKTKATFADTGNLS